MPDKKLALIILDGWGLGPDYNADAIATANTPFFDKIMSEFPHNTLITFGEEVGLPDGQMGNSEVGHLNLGAGRVVYQELARINKAMREKELYTNPVLLKLIDRVKSARNTLHLIGLVSDGGVHSHINHLMGLCDLFHEFDLPRVSIHAFLDGRDCDPKSGAGFVKKLLQHIEGTNATLTSMIGRYYAMDRDKRWERIKKAYDLLTQGIGEYTSDPVTSLHQSYAKNITDEFIEPYLLNRDKDLLIKNGDAVLFFNFRTDRPRQITEALTQKEFPDQQMSPLNLDYVTMTDYDSTYKNVQVLFKTDNLNNTLGEVMESNGKTQLRMAETEKYPHVTFFFNGGREVPFKGEDRIMVASPKVATYDLQPEMSAPELAEALLKNWDHKQQDFICLNFANTDMVGHTGVFSAGIKAAETVDACLQNIVNKGKSLGYEFIVLADHGNADCMINPDGSPNTAHTKNPVPVIYIGDRDVQLKHGKLGDVAPTILTLMGLEIPKEMEGKVLI
ncbi:MAG: 2,3-bisphosphoglycerate-independent phosphoglycerate mutase [Saprospiraceae bacterium]|nr:2,3-bisphosphoglycerate-independent phosphoglycerate mutase [Saprospiraceae bacterium]